MYKNFKARIFELFSTKWQFTVNTIISGKKLGRSDW